jgi:uncharacterized protein
MLRFKKEKMKKLGIMAIYLFGSKAEGTSSFKSDIDIGIVIKDTRRLENTQSLYNILYREFLTSSPGEQIDIVFLQQAPVPLQYNAVASGKVLYEEDPVKRAEYEESVINHYLDFKPILDYIDSVALLRHVA